MDGNWLITFAILHADGSYELANEVSDQSPANWLVGALAAPYKVIFLNAIKISVSEYLAVRKALEKNRT